MTRLLQLVFMLTVFSGLSLPYLQQRFDLFRDYPLAGVEEKTVEPSLSISSWFDGSFQKQFDSWFSENVGLRTQMVRSENELNFAVFGDISSKSPSRLLVGKDNYLFERDYVLNAVHPAIIPKQDIKAIASRVIALGQELTKRKIALVVLISPNKANLYPDKLPEKLANLSPDAGRNRRIFREQLESARIAVLEGNSFLEELRKRTDIPVFPKSGTHWSYAASCYVADEIIRLIELQGTAKLRRLGCEKTEIENKPRAHDKDLAELMNLWNKQRFYEPLPYPKAYATVTEDTERPPVVFVGSSFMWPILAYFDKHKTFETREFLYYFKRRLSFPSRKEQPIDKQNFDWQKIVFNKKAIIIEANEIGIGDFGWGFVEEAHHVLIASPSTTSSMVTPEN